MTAAPAAPMNWRRLMSRKRFGGAGLPLLDAESTEDRSPFLKDTDRLVYCSAFRRLQNKTQVQVFPGTDYVRTRLTHSLEVSSVGRSLGAAVGAFVLRRHPELKQDTEAGPHLRGSEFGEVVAAACLAHDIGNPPFGHAGEDAIRDWFWNHSVRYLRGLDLTPQQIGDLLAFEGNAQGFRILTKLQGWRARGGLQLSCATLGVFMKYPFPVDPRLADERVTGTSTHTAKFGYFQADAAAFRAVCEELGLLHLGDGRFARHPLAFLVEAADDICYSIVDIEDAFKFGLMDFGMAEDVLLRIIGRRPGRYDLLIGDGADQSDRIQYLRAKAIGELVDQTVRAYRTHYDAIMAGAFADDLLDHVESAAGVAEIRELCERHLYGSRQKVERELMGFSVVHGLLEIFVEAVHHWGLAGGDRTALAPKYRRVLDFITGLGSTLPTEPYERLLFVTDIVSGMTDSFALTTYRKLKGISYAD